jgi:hypothetical protein
MTIISKMLLHNETENNDNQHNDIEHNDTQHNDTNHNDTQHNETHPLIITNSSIMLSAIHAFFLNFLYRYIAIKYYAIML